MIAALSAAILIAVGGPVHRYSTPMAVHGVEVVFSDQGVIVQPIGESAPILVPWFDVRSVPDGWNGEAAPYEEIARLARTARERRARGDFAGAEPLYQTLEQRVGFSHEEQGVDIAIGLMEAAIARGDTAAGVVPWLFSDKKSAGQDPQTDLHPEIPPIGAGGATVSLEDPTELGEREQILLGYYQLALSPLGDKQPDELLKEYEDRARKLGNRDAGLQFVHEIVACQVAEDPSKRRAARESLSRRLRSRMPAWMESWARVAIGASLIGEREREHRERGVLECIAVIADPHEKPASVVRLSVEIASAYLRETGRDEYADRLVMSTFIETGSSFETRP